MAGRRIRIDLRRSLPSGARWTLAVSIVAVVSVVAWWIGRDTPAPAWIGDKLIPALGWIYLVLLAIAVVHLIRKRWGRRQTTKEDSP